MKTYYGNEPIKDLEKINSIFELYEKSGIIHYQDMLKLKTYLTPPTAEEVCEALSRYLKSEVKYIPHRLKKNGFYLVDSGIYLVSLGDDNQVNFSCNDWMKFNRLPPHLITLIGRFYEGLEKGEGK